MIPQTLIIELLTRTVRLKTYWSEQFQQKIKKKSGDFNYCRHLLHTHACSKINSNVLERDNFILSLENSREFQPF